LFLRDRSFPGIVTIAGGIRTGGIRTGATAAPDRTPLAL
jgi:hypothetical protein